MRKTPMQGGYFEVSLQKGVWWPQQHIVAKEALTAAQNFNPGVEIVKDGVWNVPPEGRPKGWESMGVKEPAKCPT